MATGMTSPIPAPTADLCVSDIPQDIKIIPLDEKYLLSILKPLLANAVKLNGVREVGNDRFKQPFVSLG